MLITLGRRYLRPYAPAIGVLLVLQLLQTLASLYLPSLNADIIDDGVVVGDIGFIWRTGGWMLAVSLGQVACAIGAVVLGARAATSFGRDLRHDLFDAVQTFSAREVGQFGAPSLITRTTNDVQQIQMVLLMGFTIMVMAPIMAVGGVIMALRQDVELSALLLVVVPVLAVVMGLLLWRMLPYFRAMQGRIDAINGVLREQITGLRVVRAFVREQREIERFGEANTALFETSLGAGKLMALAFPAVMLVMNASSVAVLWFGAQQIDRGAMQVGSLTAFLSYLMQILMAVMMSTMMVMMVPRAAVAANRVVAVLDTQSSVVEPTTPVPLASVNDGDGPRGVLRFDDVEFRYPGADEPVLAGVAFEAVPGTVTAVIGSTGAGKTTLLGLVPRLFDATGGTVSVDGVDVRSFAQADLASLMGLVPQKAFLFSGTIASNLRYGRPDATDDELWAALEIAQARDFVEELADGLEAPVTQGGTTFSGGQRQRLAIARAVVRRPRIYLFDDSFSALDYATDARLRAALAPRTADATVLVVAQRVATIRDADQILVLEHGRIVGRGTHAELLASNATYQEIVTSQMSLEEAA
ncbi:ABC transporter related protein [Xylanimonas cellulosilytica DSM 15894]|uniref:ABC transporter related protein n=1 Tax=Xylanimonas cellulosilytica (strain DSM 15894 / JCM 12276 / CECT 5975 / KCTC 9989 / LMG 20990 / NBRC 107835 / XIL07) TaxID=446471 RepID=D1BRX0_XYLCX|nr:ABC transporter ATP-binding protein [Xylanimonas cellulosilytica]ACZ30462.1 ABC transporter related protein [Xylanimonas cellulosilytica DSM 15894]